MASSGSRTIPKAVRELLLAFPGVEEFESHGSPNFRARDGARKGKVFAVLAINHHGDGHVALWLNTPAIDQARLLQSAPKHLYKPPYVGPSGWIGVELNRGISWKRVIELAHMAYVNSSPAKLVAVAKLPAVAAPTLKMKPEEIDRLKSAKAMKMLALMRKVCLALPETEESPSFGSPTWRVGKKAFASLSDYGKGLTASFWVGIERQGPLEMDPRFSIPAYSGHNGWIALDLSDGVRERELRELVIDSYRHFATQRALSKLNS
jgi:predicted DNA-binding protein (MmcQ/YjbR family)